MPSAELTSARSPRVQAARRLNRRALRARERRFLAEGPQAVREALALPGCVQAIFATRAAAERHPELTSLPAGTGTPFWLVSGEVMAALCQTVTPQGVVAVCTFVDRPLADVLAAAPRLVVVLADARDPGNVGTVIRAADAAGADAVVLAGATVDPYNGKCVRASAGSLFHLSVVDGVPVEEAVTGLRGAGLRVLAADRSGALDLDTAVNEGLLTTATAWLFGNEAWGLREDRRRLADDVVRVPIYGKAESLNLAAAAAVCLYASARAQRGQQDTPPGNASRGTPAKHIQATSSASFGGGTTGANE